MTDVPALETRDLTIRFGGHVAVNAVSCTFRPGTLTAIVGPNGAGKTTYFNLISGQLRATAGRVLFARRRHDAALRPRPARAAASAAPFSSPTCSRTSRCARTSASPCRAGTAPASTSCGPGRARTDLIARPTTSSSRWRSASGARSRAAALSHGDQRKLEVAMLMALKPDIFMFDEPTAGMSVDEVPAILNLIADHQGARRQDHPPGRAQDGRGALAGRPHHRPAQRHAGRRRQAGRGDRARRSCRRPISGWRPMPEADALLSLKAVETHIGRYHILHGVDFTVPRGGLTDAARPQRRRQDDDAAHHHGPVARFRRRRRVRRRSDHPAQRRRTSRIGRRLRAREHGHLLRPHGERESAAGGARRRHRRPASALDVRPLPGAARRSGRCAPAPCPAARSRCCPSPAPSSSRAS